MIPTREHFFHCRIYYCEQTVVTLEKVSEGVYRGAAIVLIVVPISRFNKVKSSRVFGRTTFWQTCTSVVIHEDMDS